MTFHAISFFFSIQFTWCAPFETGCTMNQWEKPSNIVRACASDIRSENRNDDGSKPIFLQQTSNSVGGKKNYRYYGHRWKIDFITLWLINNASNEWCKFSLIDHWIEEKTTISCS